MSNSIDLSNPVPDVCEIVVEADGRRSRVDSWWKIVPLKSAKDDFIDQLRREDPEQPNHKLIQCRREEATVLGISGTCGGLVRITQVTRLGEFVQWSDKMIQEHRDAANNIDNDNVICQGYKRTLERLFPEIDFTYR